ncbi:MAG: hypothetical protein HZB85_08080 [Deltaproteobacteria bacterium]|nr:hypothetical protein [Deltaproteobacteria bacterium]
MKNNYTSVMIMLLGLATLACMRPVTASAEEKPGIIAETKEAGKETGRTVKKAVTKEEVKETGRAIKEAGKETGHALKETGHELKEEIKKLTNGKKKRKKKD